MTSIFRLPAVSTLLVGSVAFSFGIELPSDVLANLGSEVFRTREGAQASLLEWARTHGEPAIDELLRQSRDAPEPEVRERCLGVLRDLVSDLYLKDGEGYIGIRMLDEMTNVPGDGKPRFAIRVLQVMPDSAAEAAGLKGNDLIVGLGEEIWHQGPATLPFGEKIKSLKPETKVQLKILADGKLKDIEVKLGRRPFYANNAFFEGDLDDLESAESEAKEAYFRQWLEQRKARK